jgi:hypothetical protein
MTRRLRGIWLVIFIGLQGCSGSGGGGSNAVACSPTATPDICLTNEHGTYNGLGVHKFMRFSVAGNRSLNISARCVTGVNTDPDLVLFKNGQRVAFAESTAINQENMSVNVTAGDYVLEITDYQYHSNGPVSQSCFDIQISGLSYINKALFDTSAPVVTKTVSRPILQAPPSTCDTTNEISVAGTATYDRVTHNPDNSLNYPGVTQAPVRGAVVEVWCNNAVYSSGVTLADGRYTLVAPKSQDFFVRVKAQMLQTGTSSWNFRVVDNTSSGALYSMVGSVINSDIDMPALPNLHAPSGWGVSSYTSTRVAAPFAILDSVYQAVQKVLVESPSAIFPTLNLNWSVNNVPVSGDPAIGQITTSHFNGTAIYILGAADDDIDEYDDHVVIHEWGHYFEHNFSRADNIGGSHSRGDVLDIRVAFGEGFGNAFSAIVTDDPQYSDASGISQAVGFGINMEDNNCLNAGWFSECSVQSILYDLYDANNDGADVLTMTFTPLYNVLVNQQKNTAAMTSVFSFVKFLKDDVDATTDTNIDNLISSQGIDVVTDIYGDSQITNNPGNYDPLPVYVHFQ